MKGIGVICRMFSSFFVLLTLTVSLSASDGPLRVAVFQADITPPLGAPLGFGWYGPAQEIVDPLSARGVVLLSDQAPIVLCAVDWILLNNGGHDAFREVLAKAARTTVDRVNVHCLHQHDAPGIDVTAEDLLAPLGLGGKVFDVSHAKMAMTRTADALTDAVQKPRTVSHVGIGKAKVEQVASNRRIIGGDGKSKAVRWSATKDPLIRSEPEGLIDPFVQLLSFWDGDTPLVAITYYATHPQSYYGKGGVSCDFPGLARRLRDKALPQVPHIHFNGASGNITAGKYNDGDPSNRPVLAGRLADGMRQAWEGTSKIPVTTADVEYRVQSVALPPYRSDNLDKLREQLQNEQGTATSRITAAMHLSWIGRCVDGHKLDLTALRVGSVWVLHLPGELFIEYQLAAQKLRPEATVCVAAYGDGGPGYIGTAVAYEQGGYEPKASLVSPAAEEVLLTAIGELLK